MGQRRTEGSTETKITAEAVASIEGNVSIETEANGKTFVELPDGRTARAFVTLEVEGEEGEIIEEATGTVKGTDPQTGDAYRIDIFDHFDSSFD